MNKRIFLLLTASVLSLILVPALSLSTLINIFCVFLMKNVLNSTFLLLIALALLNRHCFDLLVIHVATAL